MKNNDIVETTTYTDKTESIRNTFIGKTIKDVQVHQNSHQIWTSITFKFTDGTEATLSATKD